MTTGELRPGPIRKNAYKVENQVGDESTLKQTQ
jgi:hypothetical protein